MAIKTSTKESMIKKMSFGPEILCKGGTLDSGWWSEKEKPMKEWPSDKKPSAGVWPK